MTGKTMLMFIKGSIVPLALTLALATVSQATAATAGELLEKAIYAEETAGNLEEAIKLYEQVISEAKAAESAAATAQYRLGLIYEKQGRQVEATAAFQAVVDKYPQETDVVAQASKRLPSALQLLEASWVDGEELQLNMKLATGIDLGTMIYGIESTNEGGRAAWKCTTRGLVTINGANSMSWVLCDRESFAPIRSHWKHSMLGEANASYGDGIVSIETAGKADPVVIKLPALAFDNEQGFELFRRLPLEVGYKTTINIVSTLGGGELKLGVEVPATETVETPAGTFECYKLVLSVGQTFWVSTSEERYVVRFAAGGVTADLARITQRKAESDEQVAGDGFELTLPAGWHSYSSADRDNKKQVIHLLDPEAVAQASLAAGSLESLKEEERSSPRAWTEQAMKQFSQGLADFKIREPGVAESEVGDLPIATVVADFTEEGKPFTMIGIAAMDDRRALTMRLSTPKDKFAELRPAFEQMVQSLKME